MNLKQNNERAAGKQKLDIEYELLRKQKDDEVNKICLKYKNRKADLEAQQKHEKFLHDNENIMKASIIFL